MSKQVIVGGRFDGPIDLRSHIVDGLLVVPSKRVRIDLVVLPVRRRSRTRLYAIDRSRSICLTSHTRRTNTKFDPRFGSLDGIVDHAYHEVVLCTAPVSTCHNCSCRIFVRIILCIIIRVLITRLMEIVIEDNTIHVVVLNDIYNYLAYLLAHFR